MIREPSRVKVRNRLLAALSAADYERLSIRMEPVGLDLDRMLIGAHDPIERVYFPSSGFVSMMAGPEQTRIEIGLIGREGLVGAPVVLGTSRSPYAYVVKGRGEAMCLRRSDLRAALPDCPSLVRLLQRYVQALIVQMAQTSYANAAFNLEARLARAILMAHDRIDGDEVLYTHDDLAALLGVRRSSITVAMHVLEGAETIRNARGRIRVRDRAKLQTMAGTSYQVAEDEYERLMAAI